MSREILLKNKKITLSPKALRSYSTTLLKEARARCNKEFKYLSQFDNGLDKLCANVWKTASDKISKELKRRVPANV